MVMPFNSKELFSRRDTTMRTIRNVLFVGTFSVLALSLTGCESMQTARDKISSIDFPYFGDSDKAETTQKSAMLASAADCPQVAIVDDLKNLTQFETPSAPTPGTKISSITLSNMESTCSLNEKTVGVDLTLTFDGLLGPKATNWKTESRSFAYPYFIAVTTPTGDILSKEVFAATIRYDGDEVAISQKEKIRQVIPLRENMSAAGYEILIGFQLTDDELNYSRMMANQPPVTEAAPVVEEKPKPKKKVAKKAPKKEEPAVEAAKVEPVTTAPAAEPAPATATATTPEATAPVSGPVAPPAAETTATPVAAPAPEATPATAPPTTAPVTTPATPDGSAAATPAALDPAAATVAPAAIADPYAPPPTQVIHVKPDGTVDQQ
jgi:hypothetical protein